MQQVIAPTLFLAFAIVNATIADDVVAVRGKTVHTMAGPPITDGMVLCRDGKIAAIGAADAIRVPDDATLLEAEVVTPGLIDAHSVLGLSGMYNYSHDQDQLESSAAVQPELRAIDAYNAQEELIGWVRGFGVTTLHTGHAPGELISGQTMVVKTTGNTVSDALLVETCTVAATLGDGAQKRGDGSPGTRGKMMAMLREQFIKAQEYRAKLQAAEEDEEENLEADNTDASDGEADDENDEEQKKDPPPRNLRLEVLVKVLDQELPLMVTAHRAHDIASVLRLAREFEINVWLDGAAEAYLLVDEIKAAGVPVIIHPPMTRYGGELQNASFETAGKLIDAGIPVVFQSGFEQYVPKTRVVLWEAAMAAAHGVAFDDALARITREPAELLGVADRVGSLEVGKDADLALFNGDPFEYTTHCTAVVINGEVVDDDPQ